MTCTQTWQRAVPTDVNYSCVFCSRYALEMNALKHCCPLAEKFQILSLGLITVSVPASDARQRMTDETLTCLNFGWRGPFQRGAERMAQGMKRKPWPFDAYLR